MKDARTMANINMYAVLPNLVELLAYDSQAKEKLSGRSITIAFHVKDGPYGRLQLSDQGSNFTRKKGPANIKLYFKSPTHFNNMIDGKANPIPLKGFTYLKFLTTDFVALTDRLVYYLRPNVEHLQNPNYFKINTYLSAYTAFYALAEIGNQDPIGKLSAKRIPEGNILVSVENGPALYIHANHGHLTVTKGYPEKHRSAMSFQSMGTANDMLNGKVDSYTCIASGQLQMKGFIPMLDHMNKLLGQVQQYLK